MFGPSALATRFAVMILKASIPVISRYFTDLANHARSVAEEEGISRFSEIPSHRAESTHVFRLVSTLTRDTRGSS